MGTRTKEGAWTGPDEGVEAQCGQVWKRKIQSLGFPTWPVSFTARSLPGKTGDKCPLLPVGRMESGYSEIGPEHSALNEAWSDGVGASPEQGGGPEKHW